MPLIHLNGTDLHFEESGDGHPVVLTHGAWTDARTWTALLERMAGRHRMITWDRRGHSRSSPGGGSASCRQDAFDLAGLIEQVVGGPAHLVGNSAGGNVVLNLVNLRSDLVLSAAVHEPGPLAIVAGTGERADELLRQEWRHEARVRELIAVGDHRGAARYFVNEAIIGPGGWERFPEDLRSILEANAQTAPDDLRDALDPTSVDVDALSRSDVPLLLSTGTDSPELEATATRELARRVPEAQLETIEGAGHIPHRTHPDEYAAMVSTFFASVRRDDRKENHGTPHTDQPHRR
jgi:pimeloyl-ACP methyl ester carboxylesterase